MIDDSQLLGSVVVVIRLQNASQEAQWRTYNPASAGDIAKSHGPTGMQHRMVQMLLLLQLLHLQVLLLLLLPLLLQLLLLLLLPVPVMMTK